MDDVNSLLKQAGCADYAEVFQRNGYDSAGHLLAMGPNDLKQVQATCGVLPGHMHRLITLLGAMNYRAHVVNGVHDEEEQSAAEYDHIPIHFPLIYIESDVIHPNISRGLDMDDVSS